MMPVPASQHIPIAKDGSDGLSTSDEKVAAHMSLSYDEDKLEADVVDRGLSQMIYLPGQDLQMKVTFVQRKTAIFVLYIIGSLLTAGILALVAGYWAPQLYRKWCYKAVPAPTEEELKQGKKIRCSVKIPKEKSSILTMDRLAFNQPVVGSKIFPAHLRVPATSHTSTERPLLSESGAQGSLTSVCVLDYRHTPLLYYAPTRQLVSLADWLDSDLSTAAPAPLTPSELDWRHKFFGDNIIDVKGPSVFTLTLREALNPFYIFTFAACGLWGYDDYMVYAIVIGVISVLGIAGTVWQAKASEIRLRKISRYELDVPVLRASSTSSEPQWQTMSSKDLVPGDIIGVQGFASKALPADMILLEGSCIANESMLTGESVPSGKVPVDANALREFAQGQKSLKAMEKNILWGGTNLMRAQPDLSSGEVKAMCLSTGWASSKGSLVKMMLFPKPIDFKFYSDAFKFLAILATIAALGFIGSCVNFVITGIDGGEIALRLIDLVTIALPPALPAILAICTNFAVNRLKRKSIFCISPQRITVAGKVSIVVSDKTGTLTETGLDVQGVRYPSAAHGGQMSPLVERAESSQSADGGITIEGAMSVTHDVNLLDGEAIGDPLEVSMLAWTGATLEPETRKLEGLAGGSENSRVQCIQSPQGAGSTAVLRKFDFSAALRRMSVMVQIPGDSKTTIYVKGAPESIIPLCDPATVPDDYDLVLNDATRKGLRVLAFGYKQVSLSYDGTRNATRDFAECHLRFLGLLFFENKLKVTTSAVLAELHEAGIPSKMCTGDSVLTAISVARSCGMIPSGQPVFVPRLPDPMKAEKSMGGMSSPAELKWTDVDLPVGSEESSSSTLDPLTLSPLDSTLSLSQVGLAITGDVFTWLLANASPETLARLLVQASVFARFSPEAKAELVGRLQAIGHCVLYCGDGSNDCGALQMADVGISLSEAEASVAAPFTSANVDIVCVVDLIKEGRNCLAVSSSLFLYVASYALLEYFGVILLYGAITSFDNASYLYQDIFLLFAVAVGAAYSKPASRLAKSRPVSRLMSRQIILSFAGAAILLMLAELVPYLILHPQSWYVSPDVDDDDLELDSQDSTTVAKTCFFGYTTLALIWNLGPPHREPLYKNWILCLAIVSLSAINLAILWGDGENDGLQAVFGFLSLPVGFRAVIFAVAVVQFLLTAAWEFLLIPRVSRALDGPLTALRRSRRRRAHSKMVKRQRKEAMKMSKRPEDFVAPVLDDDMSTEKTYRRVERALKYEEEQRTEKRW
jgi:cation-transporting ATPase 13A3/4/5